MTKTATPARPQIDDRADTFFLWIQRHTRQVAIAGVLVVALGVAVWLWRQSRVARERNASIALLNAARSVQSGNLPLAQSDLETLVTRYEGTNAAAQAAFELASIYYGQGQYDRGIALLEKLAESSDDPLLKAMAENGVAAGHEGAGKFADAAGHYRRAAELTRFEDEREIYLANAARAYQAAGNKTEAVAIWRQLVESEGTQAAEARVRLGELTAEPARQG
ncbi:MAG TPA: tetratricopeptide repeat protein [Gemmatimonadaceae bacterium]|nr:tetratricopeptide repeat protein [Gemmatimonadaceae bacterium]